MLPARLHFKVEHAAQKEGEVFTVKQFFIWFAFAFPVVLQGAFANADRFLTPMQVKEHWGRGLPFLAHGGMWSDIVLFAPLMAYLIDAHWNKWGIVQISLALAIGLTVSIEIHERIYAPAGLAIPEAHTHDGMLTVAGWIHCMYMGAGIAVLVLYYLFSRDLAQGEVWTVSGLLFVHTIIGTHVPFRAWARLAEPMWYPLAPVFDPATAFTIVGAGLILAALSFWR